MSIIDPIFTTPHRTWSRCWLHHSELLVLVEHLAGPADVHSWIPGPKKRSFWMESVWRWPKDAQNRWWLFQVTIYERFTKYFERVIYISFKEMGQKKNEDHLETETICVWSPSLNGHEGCSGTEEALLLSVHLQLVGALLQVGESLRGLLW